MASLQGKVALVAGATRGAGRGIAVSLGALGAKVWCTGRSVAGHTPEGRPETIEQTAKLVQEAGGTGRFERVDHTDADQVRALCERIRAQDGGLDILVNDIWGGDALTEWTLPFWEHDLDKGLRMQERAVHTHLITARFAVPLLLERQGLVVEITDGVGDFYRGSLYYDLAKAATRRLGLAMARELEPRGCTALTVTPGFLRSEAVLDHCGVSEANWRDAIDADPHFAESETPYFVGRGIAALAADPDRARWSGKVVSSGMLGDTYSVDDVDGRRPHFGVHARRVVREALQLAHQRGELKCDTGLPDVGEHLAAPFLAQCGPELLAALRAREPLTEQGIEAAVEVAVTHG